MKLQRHAFGSVVKILFLCMVVGGAFFLSACNPVVNFFAFHPDSTYQLATDALPADTKEVFFDASDGVRIQALLLDNAASKSITVYFHGNAGNIYHRVADLQRLRQLGTSVLAVSYRGYAKSAGSPSETGIYQDAKAAFDYATGTLGYPPSRVFIFGRSIGSTAATDLAQGRDIAGLILVSPLSSAKDQANAMGLGFAEGLTGNAFNNVEKIKRIKAPLFIIHGTRDNIIPIRMGRAVHAAALGEKFFAEIDGAGHNDLSSRYARQYWDAIRSFLAKVSAKN